MFARLNALPLLAALLTLLTLAARPIYARLSANRMGNDRLACAARQQWGALMRNRATDSLQERWSIVARDRAAGDYGKVLNDLQTFIQYIRAQPGSHISPAFARTMQRNALRVYYKALVEAKARS